MGSVYTGALVCYHWFDRHETGVCHLLTLEGWPTGPERIVLETDYGHSLQRLRPLRLQLGDHVLSGFAEETT